MSNNKYYDGMTSGVVESGEIRGYKWEIRINRGNHPCAYVTIPDNHFIVESGVRDYYDVERQCGMHVHGGLTYMHGNTIGWDYAHAGDFTYYAPSPNDHKWTHEEIMEDINQAVEELENADKPFQVKRKVEGLLREIGKVYMEHIIKRDESIDVDYFYPTTSDDSVLYNWPGGHCKLSKDGVVEINANFSYTDPRGKELYKRDVSLATKNNIEWYKKRIVALEQQLKEL